MLDALKSLFENNVISEEIRAEIQEAWDKKIAETRLEVTAELREEFASKYEHDKAQMVEAIVRDQKRVFPVCAWLEGEYGMKDIYLGVPVILGKNGIERIIELDLNDDEKALLTESAEAVRNVMSVLDNMNVGA